MAKRTSMKQLRKNAPSWIYPWRDRASFSYGMWLAILITGGFFAFGVTFLNVRMPVMMEWSAPQASVMYVSENNDVGAWLKQRAQAEGPFPSRFDPVDWKGGADMEHLMMQAVRQKLTSYAPPLKDLPEEGPSPVKLAAYGEPELPTHKMVVSEVAGAAMIELIPIISPISGIAGGELPTELPKIPGDVDPALALEAGRFLLRLDASGRVLDCVSMAGGSDQGPSPIQKWLKALIFNVSPEGGVRWVAVGVGFKNQVVSNESDTD